VNLGFLGAGKWHARWWHDAKDSSSNAEHIDIEERDVTAADSLDLVLAPAGGAVLRFVRAD